MKLFVLVTLNGLTLAGLYFLVASGFTLIFGLLRTLNLAHGAIFLLGGYIGFSVAEVTGSWTLALVGGSLASAAVGTAVYLLLLGRHAGDVLQQALLSIGVSIVLADQILAVWGGQTYQIDPPEGIDVLLPLPLVRAYPFLRLSMLLAALIVGVALWLLLNRTRFGLRIRAGVEDRQMLSAMGVDVPQLFLGVVIVGSALAGAAGVIAATILSLSPGEDVHFLLASLIVVIVGGMGSVSGAALGAVLVALIEQYGSVYFPTYSVVLTFLLMAVMLALRPQGLRKVGT